MAAIYTSVSGTAVSVQVQQTNFTFIAPPAVANDRSTVDNGYATRFSGLPAPDCTIDEEEANDDDGHARYQAWRQRVAEDQG